MCGDGNDSPGLFLFGENGTLLSWFGRKFSCTRNGYWRIRNILFPSARDLSTYMFILEISVNDQFYAMTATYNYLDGLFYTQTYTGLQIDNPATRKTSFLLNLTCLVKYTNTRLLESRVDTVYTPWPGYGYAIAVRAVDPSQFEIVSGTQQGKCWQYHINSA